MPPRSAAFLAASLYFRVVVKLVVPNNVVKRAAINFGIGRANWVRCCIACTTASHLERRRLAACVDKLLAKRLVMLHFTTKRARSRCPACAARELRGIEFENKPPINRMPFR